MGETEVDDTNPGYPRVSDGVDGLRDAIADAGLEGHVVDLETTGYTVVPGALDGDQVAELTEALVRLAAEDEGAPVDVVSGRSHADRTQEVPLLLTRGGRAFEELILSPRTLPLVTYLLGASRIVSSVTGYVKGPGRCALGIHSDTAYVPDPLPPYAQLANVNYALTDYTVADGCLSMVPGSHRYCYRPREGQGVREMVPVEVPSGAAIVFHGNTWHGAYPRTAAGVRLTISTLFARMYLRPQENYAALYDDAALEGRPPALRALVGRDVPTGWASPREFAEITDRRGSHSRAYYSTRGQHW
ncbi:phytanoyl-CoA dioxygenase family protein [Lentzea sp. JNUCC 0626]|uniref:phytanoyl-CoA dioxygenase family protein n=1 Tax=Lentzea sp. JNUCC 0626 TaxID=3367513 RepID=UPI00374A8D48